MKLARKLSLLHHLFKAKLPPLPRKKRGNLIIRLDRIGDFALYAPYLRAALSKDEENYLLVNELWAELCEKLFPGVRIIPLTPARFLNESSYRSQMLKTVSKLKVREVIQPRFYRELFVEELLALAASPDETVRFEATPFHLQPELLRLFSSRRAGELPYIPEEHELQRNSRFAEKCDNFFKVENPWLSKPFSLPKNFPCKDYVCVFPGSGKGKLCCWQSEKWGELLKNLDQPFYLITGTPAEKEMIDTIVALLPPRRAAGMTDLTLAEFAGVVTHARFALGNDTGGIHLAAMSGVPSAAISGRGQPGWFLPYPAKEFLPQGVIPPLVISSQCSCENCFWRCNDLREGVCRCVADITVSQVQSALEKSSFSAFL